MKLSWPGHMDLSALTLSFKGDNEGLRDDSVVKDIECSCRGSGINS